MDVHSVTPAAKVQSSMAYWYREHKTWTSVPETLVMMVIRVDMMPVGLCWREMVWCHRGHEDWEVGWRLQTTSSWKNVERKAIYFPSCMAVFVASAQWQGVAIGAGSTTHTSDQRCMWCLHPTTFVHPATIVGGCSKVGIARRLYWSNGHAPRGWAWQGTWRFSFRAEVHGDFSHFLTFLGGRKQWRSSIYMVTLDCLCSTVRAFDTLCP